MCLLQYGLHLWPKIRRHKMKDRRQDEAALEEQRIGMMYLNLFKARMAKLQYAMFGRGVRRSSLLPWVVGLLILAPVVVYMLHVRGRFHIFKQEIKGPQAGSNVPRPGGLEAMVLTRTATPGGDAPEFLSATLLPGLGMDVLQISAFLPGRGEVELLSGPTVEQVAGGTSADRSGSDDDWGAIEMPWGGSMPGALSPLGTTLTTMWRGHSLELPVNGTAGRSVAEGGLLAAESADASKTADGLGATGKFKGTVFSDRWLSRTDVTVAVTLGAKTLDLTVTARNVGNESEPMGVGWHPRFAVPSGSREGVELKLPNGALLDVADRVRNLPTGKVVAAPASLTRMQEHSAAIGAAGVDEGLIRLKAGADGGRDGRNGRSGEWLWSADDGYVDDDPGVSSIVAGRVAICFAGNADQPGRPIWQGMGGRRWWGHYGVAAGASTGMASAAGDFCCTGADGGAVVCAAFDPVGGTPYDGD